MPNKQPSAKQLAQRQAFGQAAKDRAAANKLKKEADSVQPVPPQSPQTEKTQAPQTAPAGTDAPSVTLTQDQFNNLMARLDKVEHHSVTESVPPANSGFDNQGKPQGVIQRYTLDPSHYISPVDRLLDLPELARHALRENFVIDWEVDQTVYETKYGTSFADPKFSLTLKRLVFDNGVLTDKRIIVQTGVFFEDPAASIKEAVALGLPIDNANSAEFLEQMRFLRYKQWLMDIFNPQLPSSTKPRITETVIDGKVYQIEDRSVVV